MTVFIFILVHLCQIHKFYLDVTLHEKVTLQNMAVIPAKTT